MLSILKTKWSKTWRFMSDRNPGELGRNESFSAGPRDGPTTQDEAEAAVQPGWEVTLVRTTPSASCILQTRLTVYFCLCVSALPGGARLEGWSPAQKLRKRTQYTCPGLLVMHWAVCGWGMRNCAG